MIIETSRGKKGVANPRIRIGTTPSGGYRAYLIVDNTATDRRMWAVAGPGGTRDKSILEQWRREGIDPQPTRGYSSRDLAERYREVIAGMGDLHDSLGRHTGLQENAFPALVESDP